MLELRSHPECDLCYLYVYPEHWPREPRDFAWDGTQPARVALVPEAETWCLLAYVVTKRGAQRLAAELHQLGELYAPIDCIVRDLGRRGRLNLRCVDARGFVDNAGQLDMRPLNKLPDGTPTRMRSNVWAGNKWTDQKL